MSDCVCLLQLLELCFSSLNRLRTQSGLSDEFSIMSNSWEKKRATKPKTFKKWASNSCK